MSHMTVQTPRVAVAIRAIDDTTRDVFVRYANDKKIELSFQRKDIETAGWTHETVDIVADIGDLFVTEGRDNVVYMIAKSVLTNY